MELSSDLIANPTFHLPFNIDVELYILFVNLVVTIDCNHRTLCRFTQGDKDVKAEVMQLQEEEHRINTEGSATFRQIEILLQLSKTEAYHDQAKLNEKIQQLIKKRRQLYQLLEETKAKTKTIFKSTKLYWRPREREGKKSRKWKDIIRKQWDLSRYQALFLKLANGQQGVITVEPFRTIWQGLGSDDHQPSEPDALFLDPMGFAKLFPDAQPFIDQLIQSRLANENTKAIATASISPVTASKAASTTTYAHALVKQSRVQYEDFTGEEDVVAEAIGDQGTVFYESIGAVDPDHLSRIRNQMAAILRQEKKHMVTYWDRAFNYKPKTRTPFESIVRIYRHTHSNNKM